MVQCDETLKKAKEIMDELYEQYGIDPDTLDVEELDEEQDVEDSVITMESIITKIGYDPFEENKDANP